MPLSKIKVLYTAHYEESVFTRRLTESLRQSPKTLLQIASGEGISRALAQEMVAGIVEASGAVCRDGVEEILWWANDFIGIEWDGQIDI